MMKTEICPRVTLIMPVRNEAAFIRRSLGSVVAQDYPADRMDIIVTDGRSTDATSAVVAAMQAQDPRIVLLDNPGQIVATGLNLALRQAIGDIIVRVDGHCEIAPDYVRRCVDHLLRDGVDGVGGPLTTVGETFVATTIATAMSSGFGVGGAAFRTQTGQTTVTDTVAFPAYTRQAVERAGAFDEELVRNQDDEYNSRLRKLGAKILLAADVRSRYYSRASLSALWSQYFQYGYWKVRVMQKHPMQMRGRQFVPPIFVAALLISLALAPFSADSRLAFWSIAGAYLVANLSASVLTARKDWRQLGVLPVIFGILHVAYGLGFLAGLVRFGGRWRTSATTPRHDELSPFGGHTQGQEAGRW
jgi:succinoglycan biosynthesis protein ExoA